MRFKVLDAGAYASLEVTLHRGETVKAESDAMVSTSGDVAIGGRMDGGILSGLARSLFTGESFFLQTLTAEGEASDVVLAPKYPGDIILLDVRPRHEYMLQKGAYLASEPGVSIVSAVDSNLMRGAFSGQGFFLLKAAGQGTVAISAYGTTLRYQLGPGQARVVDNGHVVAWTAGMTYNIEMASHGILNSMTSGEGLVCRFVGPGEVYVQSRSSESLGEWLGVSPQAAANGTAARQRSSPVAQICFAIFFFGIFIFIAGGIILSIFFGGSSSLSASGGMGGGRQGGYGGGMQYP
eukprot:Opistho-2@52687